MNNEYQDNFLAKWLNNELNEATLQKFKASEDYDFYNLIITTVDNATVPEFDVEKNFKATLKKITQEKTKSTKQPKVRKLISNWVYAVASCFIGIIGIGYTYFFAETSYTTQIAQKTDVVLPDGSKVYLNAKSKISYKTYQFKNERTINLEGEAFFDVKKGNTFLVKTQQGSITVLGTTFSIKQRNTSFKVDCYTGKVAIKSTKDSLVLAKGERYHLQKSTSKKSKITVTNPSWMNNESVFNAVDILEVINELERQYNISIKGKENLKEVKFSGRFSHTNINKAIKTVFTSMQIPYTKINKNTILIKKH